ncbi:DNA mismatch repair endonuclease MutL [Virgibacillus ndiopensis]|uniref:DNA mismatch repair endonuclease MutL n=1 Tax=Virgibacillus ndiopensis TaxID=2004408 RepID=UPI000C08C187|nr:DNA mismatch repair endonuclease MutL [Virgibacillus ndiopensis]
MKIFQMSDALANKIAAGEVVERPASVVKELIENSIDANSTWIKVDLAEAGLQQIKITDDGDGMAEKDCETAFLRHATSKIKNETDLFHVKTLGFRGEALASIAAVSRLTVKTSQGNEAGTFLRMEGGKVIEKSKSDARKGSEINVEDLFFNTPARLKYMKTIHTELGHITDLLNRLALSHPTIRFEATHNGKQLFKTSGSGDLLQVVSHVYGMSVAKKMIPIQHETLDFAINGFIAKPEVTRASRNYISTIINGRYIKSIPLSQAIIRGYHTLLPIGRQPIVVISIEMDPILVDVNVHPTKLEVRFSKDKELFSAIEETIRKKFREITLIPELEQKEKHNQNQNNNSIQNTMEFDTISKKTPTINWNSDRRINENQMPFSQNNVSTEEFTKDNQPDVAIPETIQPKTLSMVEKQEETEKVDSPRVPTMYPIGQLHGTYIIAQNENGLYMIDQHAAQERVKYEFFKQKLGKATNESQELLIPMTFDFSKQEAIFIEQCKEELEKVGLFFESFGNQSYIIRSHPNWFPQGFEEEVIREMIAQIMEEERINIESIREDAAILMSCKRSIKANHYLNQDDMFRLLEDLRSTTDPFTCPHGRPIIVHFSSYELEKMFKRVM